MVTKSLSELLREADSEKPGDRTAICVMISGHLKQLLAEAAWAGRTSQAGLVRVGIELAAQAVARKGAAAK